MTDDGFLTDLFEETCVATYGTRPQNLPIAQRLALEMAFFAGARAFRMALAVGSMPLMGKVESEMKWFGNTIIQRHADAGLPTGFPKTLGST